MRHRHACAHPARAHASHTHTRTHTTGTPTEIRGPVTGQHHMAGHAPGKPPPLQLTRQPPAPHSKTRDGTNTTPHGRVGGSHTPGKPSKQPRRQRQKTHLGGRAGAQRGRRRRRQPSRGGAAAHKLICLAVQMQGGGQPAHTGQTGHGLGQPHGRHGARVHNRRVGGSTRELRGTAPRLALLRHPPHGPRTAGYIGTARTAAGGEGDGRWAPFPLQWVAKPHSNQLTWWHKPARQHRDPTTGATCGAGLHPPCMRQHH
jgi:hypothetical protein